MNDAKDGALVEFGPVLVSNKVLQFLHLPVFEYSKETVAKIFYTEAFSQFSDIYFIIGEMDEFFFTHIIAIASNKFDWLKSEEITRSGLLCVIIEDGAHNFFTNVCSLQSLCNITITIAMEEVLAKFIARSTNLQCITFDRCTITESAKNKISKAVSEHLKNCKVTFICSASNT